VIDTPGFGDYVNNRDSWMPIIEFLDDQHESYMLQEQQPRRQDKIDLRVHACLYFIRPTGHTLKPLDIEVMKRLCTRVNLIPVVAKADTLSPRDLARFKQRASDMTRHSIRILKLFLFYFFIFLPFEGGKKRKTNVHPSFGCFCCCGCCCLI
jgi:septin family protein